jgi:hypothetical protein
MILVAGFLAPDEPSPCTSRPEFRLELDQMAAGYIIDVRDFRTQQKEQIQRYLPGRRAYRLIPGRIFINLHGWTGGMQLRGG